MSTLTYHPLHLVSNPSLPLIRFLPYIPIPPIIRILTHKISHNPTNKIFKIFSFWLIRYLPKKLKYNIDAKLSLPNLNKCKHKIISPLNIKINEPHTFPIFQKQNIPQTTSIRYRLCNIQFTKRFRSKLTNVSLYKREYKNNINGST